MSELELDRFALMDADMAFLDRQRRADATTAKCVEAAIVAYLAAVQSDADDSAGLRP